MLLFVSKRKLSEYALHQIVHVFNSAKEEVALLNRLLQLFRFQKLKAEALYFERSCVLACATLQMSVRGSWSFIIQLTIGHCLFSLPALGLEARLGVTVLIQTSQMKSTDVSIKTRYPQPRVQSRHWEFWVPNCKPHSE